MQFVPAAVSSSLRDKRIKGPRFREIIRQFGSTVVIITVANGGRIHG